MEQQAEMPKLKPIPHATVGRPKVAMLPPKGPLKSQLQPLEQTNNASSEIKQTMTNGIEKKLHEVNDEVVHNGNHDGSYYSCSNVEIDDDDESFDSDSEEDFPGGCNVLARHPWNSGVEGDLTFIPGDLIKVISRHEGEWWNGALKGEVGLFPETYVTWPAGPQPARSTPQLDQEKNDNKTHSKGEEESVIKEDTKMEDKYEWDPTKAYMIAFHIVLRRKIASCVMHDPNSTNFFLNASYNRDLSNFTALKSQEDLNAIGNINFRDSSSFVSYTFNEIKSNSKGQFSEAYHELLLEVKDLSNEERRQQLLKSAFKGLSKQKPISEMLNSWNDFNSKEQCSGQEENDFVLEYEREIKNLMDWSRTEKGISDPSLLENIAWVLKNTSPVFAKACNIYEGASKEFSPRVDEVLKCFENDKWKLDKNYESKIEDISEYEAGEFPITTKDITQQITQMAIDPKKWMSSEASSAFGLTNSDFRILKRILRSTSNLICRFKFKWVDIHPVKIKTENLNPWFAEGIIEAAYAAGRDAYFWKNPSQWDKFFGREASPKLECGVKSICVTDDFKICGTLNQEECLHDVLFPMRDKFNTRKDENEENFEKLEEKIPRRFLGLKYVPVSEKLSLGLLNEGNETFCFEHQHSVAILGVKTKSWNKIEVQKMSIDNSSELSKEGCIVVYGSVLQSRDELKFCEEGYQNHKLFSYTNLGDINADPGFGLCLSDAELLLPRLSKDKETRSSFFSEIFPAYIEGAVSGGPLQYTYCRVYKRKAPNYVVSKVPSDLSKIWKVTPATEGPYRKLKWEPVLDDVFKVIDLDSLFQYASSNGSSRVLIIRATVAQRENIRLKSPEKFTQTPKILPKDVFAMDLGSVPSLEGIFNNASDEDLDTFFELQRDPNLYERFCQEPIVKNIIEIMMQDDDSANEVDGAHDNDLYNMDLLLVQSIFSNSGEIGKEYDFGLSEKKLLRQFQKDPEKFNEIKKDFFGNAKIRKVIMDYLQAQKRKNECLLENCCGILDDFCLQYRGHNKDKITLSYQDVFLLRTKANINATIQDLMAQEQNKSESCSILASILGFMLEQLKMGMSLDSIFMDKYFYKEPLRGSSSQTLLSCLLSTMSGFMQSKIISMYGLQDLPMPFCVPVSKNTAMFYWWIPLQAYFQHLMQSVPTIISLGTDIKCGKSMLMNELFQCNFGSSDDCIDHFGIQFLPNGPAFNRGFHLVDIHGPALHYSKLIELCIGTFSHEAWYIVHISATKTLSELSDILTKLSEIGINVNKQLIWLVRNISPSTSSNTEMEKVLIQNEILPAASTKLFPVEDVSVVEPFGVPRSRIFTIPNISEKGNIAQSMIRQLGIRMKYLIGDGENPYFPYSPVAPREKINVQPRSLSHYQDIQSRLSSMCDHNMRIDRYTDNVLNVDAICQESLKPILNKCANQDNASGMRVQTNDLHVVFLPFSMHEHKLKETKDKFRVQSTDNYEKRQGKKKKLEPELQKLKQNFKIKNVTPFISYFSELLSNVENDCDSINVFACALPLICKPYLKGPEEELTKLRQQVDKTKTDMELSKKILKERGCNVVENVTISIQRNKSENEDAPQSKDSEESKVKALSSKLNELGNRVFELDCKIQRSTISIEHCLREISFARDANCLPNTLSKDDHVAALAKLLFQGWPLELLDGDHLDMKPDLMKQVFAEAQRVYKTNMAQGDYQRFLPTNEKILKEDTNSRKFNPFFVSVIGPQSSGKSTLLNFLFGGSFQVAGGRCTKGLSVSVVPTDTDNYANPLVILDTEGLMSIERDDPEFDRKMMLFTMASSHVVLINVKGQINTNMSNILGIAVFALDKFKFHKTRPKLIFVLRDMSLSNKAEHKDLFLGIRKELDIVCKEAKVHLDDVIEFHGEESCFLMPSAYKDDYSIVQDRDVTRKVVTKRPMSDMFIDCVKSLREDIFQEAKKRSESNALVEDLEQWIGKSAETWTRIQDCSDLFDIDRVAELRLSSEISDVHEKLMKRFEEKWDREFEKILQKYTNESRMLREYEHFNQEVHHTLEAEQRTLLREIEETCSAEYYGTKLIGELSDRVRQQMRSFKLSAEEKGRIVRGEHHIQSRISRCRCEMDQWVTTKALELKQQSQNSEEIVVAEFNQKFADKTAEVEKFLEENSSSQTQISTEVESDFRNILDSMSAVDKPCAHKHLTDPQIELITLCGDFLKGSEAYQPSSIRQLETLITNQTQRELDPSKMATEWNVGNIWDQSMPDWRNFVPIIFQEYLLDDSYVNVCNILDIAPPCQTTTKHPNKKGNRPRPDTRHPHMKANKSTCQSETKHSNKKADKSKYGGLTEYVTEYVGALFKSEGNVFTVVDMSHRLIFIAVVILITKVCQDLTSDVEKLSVVEYNTVKPIVLRVAEWVKHYELGLYAGQRASLQVDLKGQMFSFLHNRLVERKGWLVEEARKKEKGKWHQYGESQRVMLKRLLLEGFNDITCAKRFAEAILSKITEREKMRQQNDFMTAVKRGASQFTDATFLSTLCFDTVMDNEKLRNMSKRCSKPENDLLFSYAQDYSVYSRIIFDAEWKAVVENCEARLQEQAQTKKDELLVLIRKKANTLLCRCKALEDGFWGNENQNLKFFLAKTQELFLQYVGNASAEKAKHIVEEMNNKLTTCHGNFSSQDTCNHFQLAMTQLPITDLSEIFENVSKTDCEFTNPITFLTSLIETIDLQIKEAVSSDDNSTDMLSDLEREKELLWTKSIGCEKCCPYCGSKCNLYTDHMGNHVTKHRISGFKGCWEKDQSNNKVFVTDICDEEANYNKQWILPENYVKGVVNAEMRQRAHTYGTKSGALTIGLLWSNANDLDLHVTCPDGSTLYFKNRTNSTGGELDHDMNASTSCSSDTTPYENIFWRENPPMGEYQIRVHLYEKKAPGWQSQYKVQVTNAPPGTQNAKKVEIYDGVLNESKRWSDVHKYTPGCTFTEHCAEAAPDWSIGLSSLSKKDQETEKEDQMKVFRQIEDRLKTYYNLSNLQLSKTNNTSNNHGFILV